ALSKSDRPHARSIMKSGLPNVELLEQLFEKVLAKGLLAKSSQQQSQESEEKDEKAVDANKSADESEDDNN
ncbi:UNVERIFIED_CONTAM: hypothetical protein HDU68_004619, partial [Siphonaria sp. JEL0065]